jgi:hypothetical protein
VLLRTLFVALLLAVLAETAVHAAHALARATLHRQALIALHEEIASAETLARRSLAQALAAGGDPRTVLPTPPPVRRSCRLHLGARCGILTQAVVHFSTPSEPASPSACPGDGCIVYEQNNDRVEEGRVEMRLSATAFAAGGATLAARTAAAAFRTMRVWPYASLIGDSDAAVPGIAGAAGDDAGIAPSGNAPGTLFEVRYENALTGVEIPANAWRAAVESGRPEDPAWPP